MTKIIKKKTKNCQHKELVKMTKKDVSSFILLTAFLLFFMIMTYSDFFIGNIKVTLIIFGLFAVSSTFFGFSKIFKMKAHRRYGLLQHYDVIIVTLFGAVATYALSINFKLGAVLAASIVGVFAIVVSSTTKITKDLPPAVYCGTFVGMAAPAILPNIIFVGVAGLAAGILYYISHDSYTGLGGKLGTVAFAGVLVTTIILSATGVI